jgi:hypothetical protein
MWPSGAGCLAALLCLMAGMAQAQTVQEGRQCPPFLASRPLVDVRLFSGPPAERAEFISRPGGWDFGPGRPGIDLPMTLLCSYVGDGPTLTVELPIESTACAFTASTWPHVLCR